MLNFNSNEMNDGILLKFNERYLIHITSCWSDFTDNEIRLTIKFCNGRFTKNTFKLNFSDKFCFLLNLLVLNKLVMVFKQANGVISYIQSFA